MTQHHAGLHVNMDFTLRTTVWLRDKKLTRNRNDCWKELVYFIRHMYISQKEPQKHKGANYILLCYAFLLYVLSLQYYVYVTSDKLVALLTDY